MIYEKEVRFLNDFVIFCLTAFDSNITLTNEFSNGLSNGDVICAGGNDEVRSIDYLDFSSPEELDTDEHWTKTIPTVFHWEHGGQDVFLTGSFSDWNARIPMNSRYGT